MPKIKGVTVTPGQEAVYAVLKQYGPMPDHALVPLVQHAAGSHQSSSGIRTRRAELLTKRLVRPTLDTTKTASGRSARVYEAR